MLICLENIVGLSNIDCGCTEDGRPANYNESKSGYFLTDPKYGVSLKEATYSAGDCFNGMNVWEMFAESLRLAIIDFETDLTSYIYKNKQSRLNAFSGQIGTTESTAQQSITSKKVCVEIRPRKIRGGKFTIKGASIGSTVTGSTWAYIIDKQGNQLASKQITLVAGTFAPFLFDEPVELPMWDEVNGKREYTLYYDVIEGQGILQNKFICCGGTPVWNDYVSFAGSLKDEIGEPSIVTSSVPFGISLDAFMSCDGLEWFCNVKEVGEYTSISVAGRAIQARAASYATSFILNTKNINFFTLLSSENLYGKRNFLDKTFQDYTRHIAENIPNNVSDCFRCDQSKKRLRKGSLV